MITAFQGRRCSSKRRTPTSYCCTPSVIGFVKATHAERIFRCVSRTCAFLHRWWVCKSRLQFPRSPKTFLHSNAVLIIKSKISEVTNNYPSAPGLWYINIKLKCVLLYLNCFPICTNCQLNCCLSNLCRNNSLIKISTFFLVLIISWSSKLCELSGSSSNVNNLPRPLLQDSPPTHRKSNQHGSRA